MGRQLLILTIALVWLINGLYCKVLNLVPRHQEIVAGILGSEHASLLTKSIGVLEMLMAVWVISRIKPWLCGAVQMATIGAMNVLEFFLVPDLLLFGKFNIVVAAAFLTILSLTYFEWQRKPVKASV